jgi:hypothetical protein
MINEKHVWKIYIYTHIYNSLFYGINIYISKHINEFISITYLIQCSLNILCISVLTFKVSILIFIEI